MECTKCLGSVTLLRKVRRDHNKNQKEKIKIKQKRGNKEKQEEVNREPMNAERPKLILDAYPKGLMLKLKKGMDPIYVQVLF